MSEETAVSGNSVPTHVPIPSRARAATPSIAADAQISDQALTTLISDTQEYLHTIIDNLKTHAGIQMLRSDAVKNNTNEIHMFVSYILAATQQSIISSIEAPRTKRLSISRKPQVILPDSALLKNDSSARSTLDRIIESVESLGLCQKPTVAAADDDEGGGGGAKESPITTFEVPQSPVLPAPDFESLRVVEGIDKTMSQSRASLRASFERVRSIGASKQTEHADPASLARERNIQHAKIQQQHRIGTRIFNTEGYKAGLAYFGRYAGCHFDTPKQVAQFLRSAEGISKDQIGQLLGKKDPFYRSVAVSYFSENYNVAGMELDQAIREFLTGNWLLPYESVAYVMGIFAEVFLAKNPEYKLRDETMLQGLANALIMLNGFQHNVQSKRTQMSLKRFTELVRSFDITEAHLSPADVKGFYKRICKDDLSPKPPTAAEMTEAVLNYPTKRMMGRKLTRKGKRDRTYFVLRDGCLFFFDKEASKKDFTPSRVVFLQGCVAHKHPVKDNELLIEHASCGPMLEAKDCALRLDKTGDHRLVLILDSETDRDAWIDAINFEA